MPGPPSTHKRLRKKENNENSNTKGKPKKGKSKRSHHQEEQCPVCQKKMYDIHRHLEKHAQNDHIASVEKRRGGDVHYATSVNRIKKGPKVQVVHLRGLSSGHSLDKVHELDRGSC